MFSTCSYRRTVQVPESPRQIEALRAIAREIAESGGATLDEAAILEEWRQELEMPGHDVVSGHGPGVPDENPWQDTPHWKVGGRDPIHVRIC